MRVGAEKALEVPSSVRARVNPAGAILTQSPGNTIRRDLDAAEMAP